MMMALTVNAVEIGSDIEFGGYVGIYTPEAEAKDVDSLAVGTSYIVIDVVGTDDDCWRETGGSGIEGQGFNGDDCRFPSNTGGDKIQIYNIINYSSNITLLNQTGNLSSYSFKYNDTGGGSIELYNLDNLSEECNYGVNGTVLNIKGVQFPVNASINQRNCNVTIFTNATGIAPAWVSVRPDSSVSLAMLATILTGVTTLLLYKAYQWDSVS